MKKFLAIFFIFAIALNLCVAEKFSFKNYRLTRITPKSEDHLKLMDIWKENNDFDVWTGLRGVDQSIDVLLPPNSFSLYETLFKSNNIPYTVLEENIQSKIDEQEKSMRERPRLNGILGKYARYSEIITYLSDVETSNQDIASSYIAGKTYQNRDLKVLVLKTQTSSKAVWLDCGIHAREWVSPSTCIWFIDRLIKDFRNNDPVALNLLNYYEFHILPLVNPDGYEYCHTTYRLWRKNRSPNAGSNCIGTDLNRNWGHQWMLAGASSDRCSDTFAGPTKDSELETKAIQQAINKKLGKWGAFITLHSYGQFWMRPWGYGVALPIDYKDLEDVSRIGLQALKGVNGITYTINSPAGLFGPSAGGSFDWTKAVAGIKYSICLELRPGQTGTDSNYGFTLPEDRAPKVGEETYIGLKAMIKAIRDLD